MIALEWRDVDLSKRQVCVRRSDWNGQITMPKGGRFGSIAICAAHASVSKGWQSVNSAVHQSRMRSAARRANVGNGVHILRHTFCSHLAMRGASVLDIKELAGHQDISTTQRYMPEPDRHRSGHSATRCPWQERGSGSGSEWRPPECLGKPHELWR
jgi:integrase